MDYSILKTLGNGSYGLVSLAKDPTNRYVAIKKPLRANSLEHERDMLELIRAKGGIAGIPRLLDTISNDGSIQLVTEYIKGQSLADIPSGSQSLSVITTYITQLITIIAELHKHNIVHNDLHHGNTILSSDGRVYVLDFGQSYTADRQKEERFSSDIHGIISLSRDWINLVTRTECKHKDCVRTWLKNARSWVNENEDAGVFLQRWETLLQAMTHQRLPLTVTFRDFPRSSDHPF